MLESHVIERRSKLFINLKDHKIISLFKMQCVSNGQLKPLATLPIMRVVFLMFLICF